jgi:hypothetical protein
MAELGEYRSQDPIDSRMQPVHPVMSHHPQGVSMRTADRKIKKIPSPAQDSRRTFVFSSYERVQHKLLGFSITPIFLRIETR